MIGLEVRGRRATAIRYLDTLGIKFEYVRPESASRGQDRLYACGCRIPPQYPLHLSSPVPCARHRRAL